MGRRVKIREYDSFLEETRVVAARDDRARASRVQSKKDLERLVSSTGQGVVASKIKEMGLFDYESGNKIRVKNSRVQAEASIIKAEILNARFYPYEETRKQYKQEAQDFGVSEAQAKNLVARDYAIRAKAVLAAGKAGQVKLDSYTVGLLNHLAAGRYETAVYGAKGSSGERKFSKGRYFTELGFDRAEKRRKEGRGFVGTEAALEEARRNFQEYTGGRGGSGKKTTTVSTAGRFGFDSTTQPQQGNRFASVARRTMNDNTVVEQAEKLERESRFSFARATEERKSSSDEIFVPF